MNAIAWTIIDISELFTCNTRQRDVSPMLRNATDVRFLGLFLVNWSRNTCLARAKRGKRQRAVAVNTCLLPIYVTVCLSKRCTLEDNLWESDDKL